MSILFFLPLELIFSVEDVTVIQAARHNARQYMVSRCDSNGSSFRRTERGVEFGKNLDM